MEISAHLINMLSTRIERRLNVASAVVAMMFIAFSASGLYAQGYGTISGTVTDPSGASVASATVKAIQTQTGRETVVTSGKEGDFVFPTLPPSVYSLSVSATGFQSYTQTDIVLQADQKLTANVRLQIGSASETVTVTAKCRKWTPPPAPCLRSSTRHASSIFR
jgi:hypothetical protein